MITATFHKTSFRCTSNDNFGSSCIPKERQPSAEFHKLPLNVTFGSISSLAEK